VTLADSLNHNIIGSDQDIWTDQLEINPLDTIAVSNAPFAFHEPGLRLKVSADRIDLDSIELDPGDVVVFYTDGVTEAMDARRQLFDEERLIEVLRRSHQLEPEEITARIIDAVTNFSAAAPQADDITLVVLKRDA